MLQRFKVVGIRYHKRLRGILRYISDYPILSFSLFYIFFTYLSFQVLRNIKGPRTMGLFFLLAVFFFLILTLVCVLRNISKKGDTKVLKRYEGRKSVKICVHLFILFLLVFVSCQKVVKILEQMEETNVKISGFTDRRVAFEGYVSDEVDRKSKFQHLNVVLLQDLVVDGHLLDKNHGYILVKTENYEKFRIGQVCKFNGTLVEPENFDDFDYKTYLNNRNIFLIMEDTSYFCFDTDRRRGGSIIKNSLIDMKEGMVGKIDNVLFEPRSSLLAGILFGKKRLFNRDFDNSIRLSGVSHLISASGYNVTIVLLIVNKTLFFLPKKIKIILGLGIIWLFAIFCGLTSSIIRACIMNSLTLFALFWGRGSTVHISLPFASALFVFFEPLIIFDVGFLLSISATLGLIYILPILTELKRTLTKQFYFLENYFLPTMSCTLSTLPVSLLTFKTFSIWSIPINALILPIMEGTMLWGVLSVLLFDIYKPLSYFFFTFVDLQLRYFQYIVERVGYLNFGVWDILNLNELWISPILFLLLFALVIYYYPIENEKYNYYLKDR